MRFGLGQKLGVVIGALALLSIGLSAFAYWQASQQRRQEAEIEKAWELALQSRNLAQSIEHIAVVATSLFARDDQAEIRKGLATLRQALTETKEASDWFSRLPDDRFPQPERKRLELRVKEFLAYQNETIELGLNVSPKAALIQANDEATIKDRDAIVTNITRLSKQTLAQLEEGRAAMNEADRRNALLLIVIPAVTIAIAVAGTFWFIGMQIRLPLARIIEAMTQVSEGALDADIPYLGRRDEIGNMAEALNNFRSNALRLREAEAQAEKERHMKEAAAARHTEETEALNAERERALNAVGAALSRLSAKDLRYRMTEDLPETYRQLKADLNSTAQQLEDAIAEVTNCVELIGASVDHISQAADDLTGRMGQQACSLEEASSALHSNSTAIKQNANGAEKASAIVGAARGEAEKGSKIVRDAVVSIERIEKSSQSIGQIIGLIDEIAFQTNLLALNAGVEAARAGEAGKGFSVVAAEVRALAQRSAEAAKEIKKLVSTSSTEVDRGVTLVAETAKALENILSEMIQIDTVVAAIANVSSDLAASTAEINVAVGQIDKNTQENVAEVEETRDTMRRLATEAGRLSDLIGGFRISGALRPPLSAAA
ncbi:methyl-accepting chemotaxis protein [Methylocystis sp. MJC1]|jgi:methyl-accepting chemotaxis protein|uniref:methyl-accepting chemotaxis protein n=1 Tax=Methylocystis sp. MJC1 TaxID=2654282 RepID=UPI0013ECE05C|nr:HAMP domain-containing methyl-accepting chemotaxis protein [Methylocystis sp. MJC1]KAF2991592.1 Methyl-accepting chemotaxis protein I [Methylocystis sp. MJC1]MBU6527169.1 HAMP domain-containing protein [Methylocystis sp. MJC1]UZX13602.1 methyl-accepting chemotaxis protein [Methylocystis sp. MJC1]